MNLHSNFLVLGAGGVSGQASVELLSRFASGIFVYDDDKSLSFSSDVINVSRIDFQDRKITEKFLEEHKIAYAILSPGFPRKSPAVENLGTFIPVVGELDFGYYVIREYLKKDPFVFAITGTDGKSTTTHLIATLLRSSGISAIECGNYGLPLTRIALNMWQDPSINYDVLVVEASSYQLEKLYFFSPDCSLLLNIAEDHLDRYDSFQEYLQAKLNIISLCNKQNLFLLSDQVWEEIQKHRLTHLLDKVQYEILTFNTDTPALTLGKETFFWKEFPEDNHHNRKNVLFALKAVLHYFQEKNITPDVTRILESLKTFKGLPYRTEKVRTHKNIIFVNDSKSTTVQATISAINSYPHATILLLMGGYDKQLDFTKIKETRAYQENLLFIFPYGNAAKKIQNQLHTDSIYENLEAAFLKAMETLRRIYDGSRAFVVLLSPACASFDQYKNYRERGEHFNRLVETYRHLWEDL